MVGAGGYTTSMPIPPPIFPLSDEFPPVTSGSPGGDTCVFTTGVEYARPVAILSKNSRLSPTTLLPANTATARRGPLLPASLRQPPPTKAYLRQSGCQLSELSSLQARLHE